MASMRGWGITVNDIIIAETCFAYPQLCYPTYEAKKLQEIQEEVQNNAFCQAIISSLGINYTVHDGLVCTTPKGLSLPSSLLIDPTKKKGPCVGDSGSPLVVKPAFFGKDVLVGLFTDTLSVIDPYTGVPYPCGNGLDLFTYLDKDIVSWILKKIK